MNTLNNVDKPKVLIVESDAEKSAELKNIISSHYEVVETVPENAVSLISNKENGITTAILYIKHAALIVRELRSFIPTAKFPILISTDISAEKRYILCHKKKLKLPFAAMVTLEKELKQIFLKMKIWN